MNPEKLVGRKNCERLNPPTAITATPADVTREAPSLSAKNPQTGWMIVAAAAHIAGQKSGLLRASKMPELRVKDD
jgi:hypothetical protein